MDFEKEILVQAGSKIVEDGFRTAWGKVKMFFQQQQDKEAVDYGYAYEEYMRNASSTCRNIKTIIYRYVPQDIYSFYECVDIEYNGKNIDANNINNILQEADKIIISGTGGIGKTILFKHLFLNTIKETNFVPVLIELRSFNPLDDKDISLYSAVYHTLKRHGFKLSEEAFEYSMQEGGYIILLDGYDEVKKEKTIKVSTEIIDMSKKYNKNKYIISSRPNEEFIGWNDFSEMQSKPLNKQQALNLIKKIDFDKKVKEVFYKELENGLFEKYESFASNPLLLNIMLLTFDRVASIPDKLNEFYEQAFSALFNMHDATKESYVRDIRSGLGCNDFKTIFSYICFKSYFKGQFEFTETSLREYIKDAKEKFPNIFFSIDEYLEDLVQSVCMFVKEGLNYRFAHRSFQEYFAAVYTCKLTDDVQQKLLTSWIKESDRFDLDSYFQMLYNLQSEKVNKIILCPGLRDLAQIYNEVGFSLELLQQLFSGISVREHKLKDEITANEQENIATRYSLSLRIKNKYLCSILGGTCRYNAYKFGEHRYGVEHEIGGKLKEVLGEEVYGIDFLDVLKIIEESQLLEGLEWLEKEIIFAINILERYENNTALKKKKVASILEEL